jgi:hypothetical protein
MKIDSPWLLEMQEWNDPERNEDLVEAQEWNDPSGGKDPHADGLRDIGTVLPPDSPLLLTTSDEW